MHEGLSKEKNDKENQQIQKEIIKNRTNLDEAQIRPELYQENEIDEFKFQYTRIYIYIYYCNIMIYMYNFIEITNYLMGNSEDDDVQEISNPINKKFNKRSKYKRKKQLNATVILPAKHHKIEENYKSVIKPYKKLKKEVQCFREIHTKPLDFNIKDVKYNDSLSSTSNNIHEEFSEDMNLNLKVYDKSEPFLENLDKKPILEQLIFPKETNNEIIEKEDSPRYDNLSMDGGIKYIMLNSDSDVNINNENNVENNTNSKNNDDKKNMNKRFMNDLDNVKNYENYIMN